MNEGNIDRCRVKISMMGNAATFVSRFVVRRTRRFNVSNRALKLVNKQSNKPQRAPLYEATMREVEKLAKELPNLKEELIKKDDSLLKNLKTVYVTSTGENKGNFSSAVLDSSADAKYLSAVNRDRQMEVAVPPGKITFEKTIELLNKYDKNPELFSHLSLSKHYNLDSDVIRKITKHVKLLEYIPAKKQEITMRTRLEQEFMPASFQGTKSETEILEEILFEAHRRVNAFTDKASILNQAKQTGSVSVEDGIKPLISLETQSKLDQIYVDTDIYRKYGILPSEQKLISENKNEIKQLSAPYETEKCDIAELPSNRTDTPNAIDNVDGTPLTKMKKN